MKLEAARARNRQHRMPVVRRRRRDEKRALHTIASCPDRAAVGLTDGGRFKFERRIRIRSDGNLLWFKRSPVRHLLIQRGKHFVNTGREQDVF